MVVYDNPKTLDGELCVGFCGEAFFQAMLWKTKRQDVSQPGPLNPMHQPTYATFVDQQEIIESGQVIRHVDDLPNHEEGDGSTGIGGFALA